MNQNPRSRSTGIRTQHAFLRTGDAVHLLSAKVSDVTEIYSNDKHLLASAPYIGMTGRDVIDVNEAAS